MEPERNSPLTFVHMVLLKKHEHLPFRSFKRLVVNEITSRSVKFFRTSAHCGPSFLNRELDSMLLSLVQNAEIKLGVANYNIAVANLDSVSSPKQDVQSA